MGTVQGREAALDGEVSARVDIALEYLHERLAELTNPGNHSLDEQKAGQTECWCAQRSQYGAQCEACRVRAALAEVMAVAAPSTERLYGLDQVRAEIEAGRKTEPATDRESLNTEANALCAEWQERLRLRDWKVTVEVRRHYRMPETVCEGGTEAGHMVKHRHTKQAEITICHPDDIYPEAPDKPEIEQTIVHELLHIHLDAWEPEPGTREYWDMECAINLLADALLSLKGVENPPKAES